MKEVIFSINKPHTDNMRSGDKSSELRLRPPKLETPYKGHIYETKKDGGAGAIVGYFICKDDIAHHIGKEIPLRVLANGCVSGETIRSYLNGREPILHELYFGTAFFYDRPQPLKTLGVKKAPQSWCYVKGGN